MAPLRQLTATLGVGLLATLAQAQATPTQSRGLTVSTFAALGGVQTGIVTEGQLSVTAGGDLLVGPDHRFTPSLEVRGAYPILPSPVVAESNVLAGPRLQYELRPRLRLAADVAFGRGSLDFGPGVRAAQGNWVYQRTNGNVLAFGGSLTWVLGGNLAARADAHTEHYRTPVTASGDLRAASFTLGLEYTLRLGHTAG